MRATDIALLPHRGSEGGSAAVVVLGGAQRRWLRRDLAGLRGEELAGADVDAGVAELRHGAGFDLADALTREVERLADLFERPRLATIEAEAQAQDLPLALVERLQQPLDLLRQ